MYAKALESIAEFGFIDPITVRLLTEEDVPFEIIDGEHRWRAALDLGYTDIPVFIVDVTPEQAKKLTVVLNELHGQVDPTKLSDLLGELLTATSIDDLLRSLPYTEDILKGYLGFRDLELPSSPRAADGTARGSESSPAREPWVERLFKVPNSVGYLLDDAIKRAKQDAFVDTGEEIKDWQALERIVAEFMAS